MSDRFQKPIYLLSIFLMSAPLWFPQMGLLTKTNWFMYPEAFFITGCSLLTGVWFSLIPSSQFIFLTEKIVEAVHRRKRFFLFLLFSCFLIAVYLVNQFALFSFMNSADEHSCYFLAECMRKGNLWAVQHPFSEFFEVIHVGNKNGKWFSVYPPGWPLLFALGLEVGMGNWVNPFLAVFSLSLFYQAGKQVFGHGAAFLALLLMSFTPFFLFNNASYFSHTTCLTTTAIFIYAYIRWRENKKNRWAIIAAFGVGYGLITRYLTMAAIATPFLFYELGQLILRREHWRRGHTLFSAILTGMIGLNLYYNFQISGNFFEAPNHYYHRWERLGFHSDYTFFDALSFILARFFSLLDWIPGGFVVLYFVAITTRGKARTLILLFRYGFFYAVVGYIFYYSWGGNQYGPRYYFEGVIFLFFAIAELLSQWWKSNSNQLRKISIGVIIACFIANGYLLAKQISFYRLVSKERKMLYDLAAATIKKPAVVFIRGFLGDTLIMAEEDAVRNNPQLNAKILYAHDLGKKNKLLMKYYPDRIFYLGYFNRESKQALLELIVT